jgi:hypothetical protein
LLETGPGPAAATGSRVLKIRNGDSINNLTLPVCFQCMAQIIPLLQHLQPAGLDQWMAISSVGETVGERIAPLNLATLRASTRHARRGSRHAVQRAAQPMNRARRLNSYAKTHPDRPICELNAS